MKNWPQKKQNKRDRTMKWADKVDVDFWSDILEMFQAQHPQKIKYVRKKPGYKKHK